MTIEKISDLPHYYVFKNLYLDFNDALKFCDSKNLPYDFIVKTKYYINFKDQN